MIVEVAAAHIARAIPGRVDPLEVAAKALGLRLSAARERILLDHGHEWEARVMTPPPWWSVLWTRFHASGQLEWTPAGWRSRGDRPASIAPYSLELEASLFEKVERRKWQPTGRCRVCGKSAHIDQSKCRAREAA